MFATIRARARAHVLAHLCRRDADENFYCGTFSLSFAEIRAEDARTFGDLEVEVKGPRLRVVLAKKEIRFSKERKYYFLFLYRIATIVKCNADFFVSLVNGNLDLGFNFFLMRIPVFSLVL